ncbi:hypothetical protein N665_1113s0011, partial [Sinapis alba]
FLQPHNILRAKLRLPPLKWMGMNTTTWRLQPYPLRWTLGREPLLGKWKRVDTTRRGGWANGDCLHYTQLVWKKSMRIGCAMGFCNSGDTFIICNYDPPGNIVGKQPL